jgi:PTS system mannitol-specific IIC component
MASTTAAPTSAERTSARVHVQKFGTFLSNMVMPNIGAFIAWGFITSLFIKVGWLPLMGIGTAPDSWVAALGGWGEYDGKGIVGPMITYLLPLLIGYTGGYNIYKTRGGVVGAIATMGVIAGTSIPMFMGAMIMGPLGGWSMKKIDALWDGKIKPGFEMLVNNFSAGIWGMILAIAAFFVMSPIVTWIASQLEKMIDFLVSNNILPATSIIIEPAKVLFLNNALNHGVLTPLGTNEAKESGKSILFLLEANPAAGLGLLLAYMFFGKGMAKASASGAAIIHFFGGIHEIYFPYVLAKPKLILAMIAGGATQIATNLVFGSGLRAPAAPGSIIAVLSQTAPDSFVGVILSVILGAAASFIVAAFLLKLDKSEDDGDLTAATASMESMKGKKSSVAGALTGAGAGAAALSGPVRSIVFACDAGMGSSAMGASVLRRKIQAAGFTDVTVVNKAIANLTDDVDLLVTHQDLASRAGQKAPSAALYTVDNFMASPVYDQIVADLAVSNGGGAGAPSAAPVAAAGVGAAAAGAGAAADAAAGGVATAKGSLLSLDAIRLSGTATDRDDAISEAGALLLTTGAVDQAYVDSMHERERSVSTYMGNLLAIPHGTNEAKGGIHHSALSFVRYPDGIRWNGKPVKFVVGVAGAGDDHLGILANLAKVFLDKGQIARLEAATTATEVQEILSTVEA